MFSDLIGVDIGAVLIVGVLVVGVVVLMPDRSSPGGGTGMVVHVAPFFCRFIGGMTVPLSESLE